MQSCSGPVWSILNNFLSSWRLLLSLNNRKPPDLPLWGNPILYRVTTTAPPKPMLCCKATFAPETCLLPACPRSCQQSSAHWARPAREAGSLFRASQGRHVFQHNNMYKSTCFNKNEQDGQRTRVQMQGFFVDYLDHSPSSNVICMDVITKPACSPH